MAVRARDIYFYKPNLIGYARVLLAVVAFCVAFEDYKLFYACYFVSAWLDAIDGHVARLYGESMSFVVLLESFWLGLFLQAKRVTNILLMSVFLLSLFCVCFDCHKKN